MPRTFINSRCTVTVNIMKFREFYFFSFFFFLFSSSSSSYSYSYSYSYSSSSFIFSSSSISSSSPPPPISSPTLLPPPFPFSSSSNLRLTFNRLFLIPRDDLAERKDAQAHTYHALSIFQGLFLSVQLIPDQTHHHRNWQHLDRWPLWKNFILCLKHVAKTAKCFKCLKSAVWKVHQYCNSWYVGIIWSSTRLVWLPTCRQRIRYRLDYSSIRLRLMLKDNHHKMILRFIFLTYSTDLYKSTYCKPAVPNLFA